MKAFVVAAPASGSGKTTVTAGIIGALRARGLRVAPFKVGPDYIDPGHLSAAAGQPCRNLDTWMLPADALERSLRRSASTADVAVVEGVMGLFDGHSSGDGAGSTAHLATLLGLPVVLVFDASAMAQSAAPLVQGFASFDPSVRVVAAVANRLGSDRHGDLVRAALTGHTAVPYLGGLLRDPGLAIPERYLGLVTAPEENRSAVLRRAAEVAAQRIDLDALLALAAEVTPATDDADSAGQDRRVPIAIAQDEAFSFYYADSLDLLRAEGAELIPFSPLRDAALPAAARGAILGGGFPELYAADLAANAGMHRSLRAAADSGTPIYAECGGHMYLGSSLIDADGHTHAMAGVTPVRSTMKETKLTLGYRVVRPRAANPLFELGGTVRAHEFHLSRSEPARAGSASWDIIEPSPGVEGYARGATWSSYIHVHLASAPGSAARFVSACEADR